MATTTNIGAGIAAAFLCALLSVTGCSTAMDSQDAEATIGEMLTKAVEGDKKLGNAILLVDAPGQGVEATWVAGVADERSGKPMQQGSAFISASVGKLFTAAALVALEKKGILSLDDEIAKWLDEATTRDLPIEGGTVRLREVTVRRLLNHTSGLPDYFEDEPADETPVFMDLVIGEPERTWTPGQLIQHTKDHYDAVGIPGQKFHYSNTNYDLAGLIAESATGLPFSEVLETYVLLPAGLRDTWMHARAEPPRSDLIPFADVWIDGVNVKRFPSISFDGAAGGLATTVADLRLFMRSLVVGSSLSLWDLATSWTGDAVVKGIDYGLALWRIRPEGLFFLLRGYPQMLGASGSTGSFLYYVPDLDAVIAGTFNHSSYGQAKHINFLIRVVSVLRKVKAG